MVCPRALSSLIVRGGARVHGGSCARLRRFPSAGSAHAGEARRRLAATGRAVRARAGRLRSLRVSHSRSVFAWRVLHGRGGRVTAVSGAGRAGGTLLAAAGPWTTEKSAALVSRSVSRVGATARPLCTRFAKRTGSSASEAATRPRPRRESIPRRQRYWRASRYRTRSQPGAGRRRGPRRAARGRRRRSV